MARGVGDFLLGHSSQEIPARRFAPDFLFDFDEGLLQLSNIPTNIPYVNLRCKATSQPWVYEVQRTQTDTLGWPKKLSKSWRKAVESAFPEAMVSSDKSLVAVCTNHEKDRHVLASAIRGHAELIVTTNLKHFLHMPLPEYALFGICCIEKVTGLVPIMFVFIDLWGSQTAKI